MLYISEQQEQLPVPSARQGSSFWSPDQLTAWQKDPPWQLLAAKQTQPCWLKCRHMICTMRTWSACTREVYELRSRVAELESSDLNLSNDDERVQFYTGLQSYAVLMCVFKYVSINVKHSMNSKLSLFKEFVLFLLHLHLNLCLQIQFIKCSCVKNILQMGQHSRWKI